MIPPTIAFSESKTVLREAASFSESSPGGSFATSTRSPSSKAARRVHSCATFPAGVGHGEGRDDPHRPRISRTAAILSSGEAPASFSPRIRSIRAAAPAGSDRYAARTLSSSPETTAAEIIDLASGSFRCREAP